MKMIDSREIVTKRMPDARLVDSHLVNGIVDGDNVANRESGKALPIARGQNSRLSRRTISPLSNVDFQFDLIFLDSTVYVFVWVQLFRALPPWGRGRQVIE